LIQGLLLAAVSPAAVGERFILSGPQPVTWATFFETFARTLGTRPPAYWPTDRILAANQNVLRNIRGAIANPKSVIVQIAGGTTGRKILQAVVNAMPAPLRAIVMKRYFSAKGRRPGEILLPTRAALMSYKAKAVAGSEKARSRLGYSPRFDFQTGMERTSHYLKWAFSDIQRTISPLCEAGEPATPTDRTSKNVFRGQRNDETTIYDVLKK
jgi:nucleoside-diphosphate-sugar epimerase